MYSESPSLAQSFYNVTKSVAMAVLFLFLSMSAKAQGNFVCSQLFESQNVIYKNYDPTTDNGARNYFSRPEVMSSFKDKVRSDENLLELEDHILFLKSELLQISEETKSKKIANYANGRVQEINQRLSKKDISYFWSWKISLLVSATRQAANDLAEGKKSHYRYLISLSPVDKLLQSYEFFKDRTNLEKNRQAHGRVENRESLKYRDGQELLTLLSLLSDIGTPIEDLTLILTEPSREHILLPTIDLQPFEYFLDIENSQIDLASVTFKKLFYDGLDNENDYLSVPDHDGSHAILQQIDRLGAGPLWPWIHIQIYSRIKELSGLKRICATFLYWNLLHEQYLRSYIVESIEKKNPDVVFNALVNPENGAEKISLRQKVVAQLRDEKNFKQNFLQILNVDGVYDIGMAQLRKILSDVSQISAVTP